MKSPHTSDSWLRDWGQNQHKQPTHNDALKRAVLAEIPAVPDKQSPFKYLFRWGVLASGMAAILLIVLYQPQQYSGLTSRPQAATDGFAEGVEEEYSEEADIDVSREAGRFGDFSAGDTLGFAAQSAGVSQKAAPSLIARIPDYFDPSPSNPTDTREFLKTNYSAYIQSRDVEKQGARLQTVVRGYGGRIDSSYINRDSAHIDFALPASNFATFKEELRGMYGDRFLEEYISTENYLPQKQSIEEHTDWTLDERSDVAQERRAKEEAHDAEVSRLTRNITYYTRQIEALNLEIPENEDREKAIKEEISKLESQRQYQRNQLAQENKKFDQDIAYIDDRLAQLDEQLDGLADEDQHVIDTVSMVTGSISINHIGIVDVVFLYIPQGWFIAIIAVGFLFWWRSGRKRQIQIP